MRWGNRSTCSTLLYFIVGACAGTELQAPALNHAGDYGEFAESRVTSATVGLSRSSLRSCRIGLKKNSDCVLPSRAGSKESLLRDAHATFLPSSTSRECRPIRSTQMHSPADPCDSQQLMLSANCSRSILVSPAPAMLGGSAVSASRYGRDVVRQPRRAFASFQYPLADAHVIVRRTLRLPRIRSESRAHFPMLRLLRPRRDSGPSGRRSSTIKTSSPRAVSRHSSASTDCLGAGADAN